MVLSYLGIRRSVGGLALLLPVVLGPIGRFLFGIEIQENVSNYYHTPMRDVFVGVMCAIGLFMFCYRGASEFENWMGNVACLAAVGVAWFPLDAHSDPMHQSSVAGYLHTGFGGLFFLTLTVFSFYFFPKNEPEDKSRCWPLGRNAVFVVSGTALLISLLAMGVYLFLLENSIRVQLTKLKFLFWMEWIAIWAFAIAWLVKGRTLLMIGEGLEIVKSFKQKKHRRGKPRKNRPAEYVPGPGENNPTST